MLIQEVLRKLFAFREDAALRVATLTPRQHEIIKMVLDGAPSKVIAWKLGISQRTVENHRAAIMRKAGACEWSSVVYITKRSAELVEALLCPHR